MPRVAPFSTVPIFVSLILAAGTQGAAAQTTSRIVVNADLGEHVISRHLYGQFAEHLGRGIYDGVWEKTPDGGWQMRESVVDALRAIKIPNLRWPGGCFADGYHWKDGIGPRADRPSIVNNIWGGVTEDNSFGTHEFLDLVERLDADPVIVGNVGSGTVQEMADWWEYLNHPGPSPMAKLRGKNGRDEPWNVRFFGIGNENWGCGGNMRPEFYADQYRRFASFLHSYPNSRAFRIAGGPASGDSNWMEVLLREAGWMIDGVDLHHYTLVGTWSKKGVATGFPESEWMELLEKSYAVDEIIKKHIAIMDRYDPQERIWLIVGEWGTWHQGEEGSNPGFLYQQNSLRDALAATVSLNIFNSHAQRIKMANIAQMVNVLQAMILTDGDNLVLTPTYHVFEFYTVHHDATLLPMKIESADYAFDGHSIPAVTGTASRSDDGQIHLTLSNLDPHQTNTARVELRGASASSVAGRILTAGEMDAHNSFADPEAVKPAEFSGARIANDILTVTMPPMSVVVLTLR